MSLLYIKEESKNIEMDKESIEHNITSPLTVLHSKFENLDLEATGLDLEKNLAELEEARKLYPLDDKLKTMSIELNHKLANQTSQESSSNN